MYWRIVVEESAGASATDASGTDVEGRFVLHRHCDAEGVHLDLRLEEGGFLVGWRIDATGLSGEPWAEEKAPHPVDWLEQDGDAVREDAGTYAWERRSAEDGVLVLHGQAGTRRLRIVRERGLAPRCVRSVCRALAACEAAAEDAGPLIADGMTARRRAVARLCGLARELDGRAFDEEVQRKALAPLSLEEIHAQLRAYEVRFDAKYPPQPVSRAEILPEEESGEAGASERRTSAWRIVRG